MKLLKGIKKGLKDCKGLLLISTILLILFSILYGLVKIRFFIIIDIAIILEIAFTLYFFRNPERNVKADDEDVLSPADGKILSISQAEEKIYMKKKATRIVIFMNLFNVHRNRIPTSGKVEYLEYRPGKFLAAFKQAVEDSNEQQIIGIKKDNGEKILFKQIAGLIARRIVCNLKKGDKVKVGDIFGMIKFGSALIVYFPIKYKINVKVGDKVYTGLSVLAREKKV